jgi:HAMP domain-containing protein
MFKKFSLSSKFSLLLLVVFIGAVVVSGVALANTLSGYTEQQTVSEAEILMQTMLSVRNYTTNQINPELKDRLKTELNFLPQTIPAYSAREVFEDFRKTSKFKDYFYKEATLNPTNLRDKADAFEAKIVEEFRQNSALKEKHGYRNAAGGDLYYIARPLAVTKESCLECHSTPDVAPKSLIATYGSANGFGWKLNEIVGAQVLSVPARNVISSAQRSFISIMGVVTIAFALTIFITNWFLKQAIIRPLNRIAKVANEVSTGNMDAEFEAKSDDEIGTLVTAFNRMKTSLVLAIDMLNRGGSGRSTGGR